MIHSMTSFARETANTPAGLLTVELRTVNHRYLDSNFKLPDSLRPLEPRLREQAAAALARGKLDCLLRLQSRPEREASLQVDREQLRKLLAAAAEVGAELSELRPVSALEVLQFPGICRAEPDSEEQLAAAAATLFGEALKALSANRRREGEKLAEMVQSRLVLVREQVAALRERLPELIQQQRARIVGRIEELDIEMDHNRLEQELVHMAQKADVDEELDRLEAHVTEVERTLTKGGPCGRRLDFLMQELNREANTLSSKSFASSTTQSAVELKVLIEQMREQIQNIE